MTFQEAVKFFIRQLELLYSPDDAKDLAFYAMRHVCKISKPEILLGKEKEISPAHEALLEKILQELKTGKPVQYIIGETEFYGLKIKVDPSVLIPRPETEELVDWILEEAKGKRQKAKVATDIPQTPDLQTPNSKFQTPDLNILDIGTGSGCIAIALKKHLPAADVYGMDISAKALETARINAALNNAGVTFIEQDILTAPHHDRQYPIIVSNPPYITAAEKQQMHSNVIDHEPHQALFVPDSNALLFYNSIADFAKTHLASEGVLFFEINEAMAQQTIELLNTKGFHGIELRKDLQGKDRMIKAELQRIT